ncbi:MAG: hypothetical protein HN368_23495, partial [Spirochaetales bacterium]|nr:hypothetical protein [Spirochaetales bacterium]
MKKTSVIILLLLCAAFRSAAEENRPNFALEFKPTFSVPIGDTTDDFTFGYGGGLSFGYR